MPAASSDIYASEPLRHLLADEARGLLPELQRCKGDHGLLLSALAGDAPPALPMLACWTRLQLAGERLEGDMTARTDESLPFVDDAFELVLLRHALEACASPRTMLHEAVRVLAPGGLLVLSGMHPLSLWTPWLAWRGRHQKVRPQMPLQVGEWLRRHAVRVDAVRRVGRPWPGAPGRSASSGAFGGGYILLAHKRSQAATPVRLVPRPIRAPADAGLASGARRNTA